MGYVRTRNITNHFTQNRTISPPEIVYYQCQFHQYQPKQQPQTQFINYVNYYLNRNLVEEVSSYYLL